MRRKKTVVVLVDEQIYQEWKKLIKMLNRKYKKKFRKSDAFELIVKKIRKNLSLI